MERKRIEYHNVIFCNDTNIEKAINDVARETAKKVIYDIGKGYAIPDLEAIFMSAMYSIFTDIAIHESYQSMLTKKKKENEG